MKKEYKFEIIIRLKEWQEKIRKIEFFRAKMDLEKQIETYEKLLKEQKELMSIMMEKQDFLKNSSYIKSIYYIELAKYVSALKLLKKEKDLLINLEKNKLAQIEELAIKKKKAFLNAHIELKEFLTHEKKFLLHLKKEILLKENKEIDDTANLYSILKERIF